MPPIATVRQPPTVMRTTRTLPPLGSLSIRPAATGQPPVAGAGGGPVGSTRNRTSPSSTVPAAATNRASSSWGDRSPSTKARRPADHGVSWRSLVSAPRGARDIAVSGGSVGSYHESRASKPVRGPIFRSSTRGRWEGIAPRASAAAMTSASGRKVMVASGSIRPRISQMIIAARSSLAPGRGSLGLSGYAAVRATPPRLTRFSGFGFAGARRGGQPHLLSRDNLDERRCSSADPIIGLDPPIGRPWSTGRWRHKGSRRHHPARPA